MHLHPPDAVREIARRLEGAGHATFAVGGAVRDAVLGLPAQDWDLATHARPPEVRRLFRRTVPIGIEHGTVGVLGRDGVLYEVTTFRRDVETTGRHAVVEFAETIEDDLARRDFTMNALAWDPASELLRDPYRGLDDLAAGLLRTVGRPEERFAEDYLRVLRALRFAGHFRLAIEPVTWVGLVGAVPQLGVLSAERVREELLKVLNKTRCASAALALYAASGALRVLYPELDALVGLGAAEGEDAWAESLRAADALPLSRPLLRTAAVLHAVGMPAARTRDLRGGWRFTGHEQRGARLAEDMLRRLRFSNAEVERIGRLVRHQADLFPPDARSPIVRRWLRALGPDLLYDLWRLRFALWRARNPGAQPPPADLLERWRMVRVVARERAPLSVGELAIGGADLKALGIQPGPRFGEILRALLERVLEDPSLNERERLVELAREELGRLEGSGDEPPGDRDAPATRPARPRARRRGPDAPPAGGRP